MFAGLTESSLNWELSLAMVMVGLFFSPVPCLSPNERH